MHRSIDLWIRNRSDIDTVGGRANNFHKNTRLLGEELAMALTTSYLVTTKNLEAFFNAIRGAKAPEHFTYKFLNQLDFASSNDRLFIGVLKGLGFLDDSGAPTQRYYAFLDQGESGKVLAEAIREAYDDLFQINVKANQLTTDEVRNKLKTLTLGQKSENVVSLMAVTFKALCELADWTETPKQDKSPPKPELGKGRANGTNVAPGEPPENINRRAESGDRLKATLHYNIQIILPDSRDPAVFDAIFKSLKDHLL
jgi:hypothetical protein